MNKTSRVVSFSAVIVFFILAPKWARPASFPECTTDSRDGSNIIRSAPCGVYGKVNSRQTVGATGTVLDITVDYMVHLPAGAPKALVLLFSGSSGEAGIQGDDTTHVVTQAGNNFLVRSAQLFAEAGYMAVTIDRPIPGQAIATTSIGFPRATPPTSSRFYWRSMNFITRVIWTCFSPARAAARCR
ncbi:MAG TPA: hypothetical protein VHV54_14080 [Candidatus Binatia bacterium]|nr:hypothetical protein [Candidatus Binatia bacterium]